MRFRVEFRVCKNLVSIAIWMFIWSIGLGVVRRHVQILFNSFPPFLPCEQHSSSASSLKGKLVNINIFYIGMKSWTVFLVWGKVDVIDFFVLDIVWEKE